MRTSDRWLDFNKQPAYSGVLRDLEQRYHGALSVAWHRLLERWVVVEWSPRANRWGIILTVQGGDGCYMDFDRRALRAIDGNCDLSKFRDLDDRLKRDDALDAQKKAGRSKANDDAIYEVCKEHEAKIFRDHVSVGFSGGE